jgi:hypothetical protein
MLFIGGFFTCAILTIPESGPSNPLPRAYQPVIHSTLDCRSTIPDEVSITGRVVDQNRKPLSQATVILEIQDRCRSDVHQSISWHLRKNQQFREVLLASINDIYYVTVSAPGCKTRPRSYYYWGAHHDRRQFSFMLYCTPKTQYDILSSRW